MWHEWDRRSCVVLVGTECYIPSGRPTRRWKYNIKMYRKVTGWQDLDWTDLAQEKHKWQALINTVFKFRSPQSTGNLLTSYATSSFARRTELVVWLVRYSSASYLVSCFVSC